MELSTSPNKKDKLSDLEKFLQEKLTEAIRKENWDDFYILESVYVHRFGIESLSGINQLKDKIKDEIEFERTDAKNKQNLNQSKSIISDEESTILNKKTSNQIPLIGNDTDDEKNLQGQISHNSVISNEDSDDKKVINGPESQGIRDSEISSNKSPKNRTSGTKKPVENNESKSEMEEKEKRFSPPPPPSLNNLRRWLE